MKISYINRILLGIPKSIYINFKLFPIKTAMKLPILLSKDVKINKLDGNVILVKKPRFGQIKIGINTGPFEKGNLKSYINIEKDSKLVLGGQINISGGSVVNICGGICKLGDNFAANAGFILSCGKEIVIGSDFLCGWNCSLIDSDGHKIYYEKDEKKIQSNMPERIFIEEHVWLASNVSVLKGSILKSNTVVSMGTIISKSFDKSNIVIGGNPNRILKKEINWQR